MPKRCAYGTCNSDTRYPQRLEGGVVFYAFPKPKTQLERCQLWIQLCGRPDSQLNPSKINKNSYVCSKHFVNGRLTPEFPNPIAAPPSPVQRREHRGNPPAKSKLNFYRTWCDKQEAASACNLGTAPRPRCAAPASDVQLLLLRKGEDTSEQQKWSSSLDQEAEPELPHIKEEQEELWISPEGEHPRGLEEADIIKFTFNPGPVKSEEEEDDEEEKPQSSQLYQKQTEQIKTEADGEDFVGSEPTWNFASGPHVKTSHSSDSETDDSRDWDETTEPQSGLNHLQNNETLLSDTEAKTLISSSECTTNFSHKRHLQEENGIQTGAKSFSCSVCGKIYRRKGSLTTHMRLHSEENGCSCSVCKSTFQQRAQVVAHMRVHTWEKPFSCSVCGRGFSQRGTLTAHLRIHTGENPFTCTVCKRGFGNKRNLSKHMSVHNRGKVIRCSVCGKGFKHRGNMRRHMSVHTKEKPLSCSHCGKGFGDMKKLRRHLRIHMGETI